MFNSKLLVSHTYKPSPPMVVLLIFPFSHGFSYGFPMMFPFSYWFSYGLRLTLTPGRALRSCGPRTMLSRTSGNLSQLATGAVERWNGGEYHVNGVVDSGNRYSGYLVGGLE